VHLGFSALVAVLAASLVFVLWFPGPFRTLSGGRELFFLVSGVDIVLGPVLTLVVFDRRKSWRHLAWDLGCIVVLQLGALVYGLHTVYAARPAVLVFEVDRFRVVSANQVLKSELPMARPEFRRLSLTGPLFAGVREPAPGKEHNDALFLALRGWDTGQRPSFWVPFDEIRPKIVASAHPVDALLKAYPDYRERIERHLRAHGLDAKTGRFLPVLARGDWVALVNAEGTPVDFLPLDAYVLGGNRGAPSSSLP
jgi:hypothetical protein